MTSYNNLAKERNQLQKSRNKLTEERNQLETSHSNLIKERDQLQSETERLKQSLMVKGYCSQEWMKFGFSCYYLTTLNGNWEESRLDHCFQL